MGSNLCAHQAAIKYLSDQAELSHFLICLFGCDEALIVRALGVNFLVVQLSLN